MRYALIILSFLFLSVHAFACDSSEQRQIAESEMKNMAKVYGAESYFPALIFPTRNEESVASFPFSFFDSKAQLRMGYVQIFKDSCQLASFGSSIALEKPIDD